MNLRIFFYSQIKTSSQLVVISQNKVQRSIFLHVMNNANANVEIMSLGENGAPEHIAEAVYESRVSLFFVVC